MNTIAQPDSIPAAILDQASSVTPKAKTMQPRRMAREPADASNACEAASKPAPIQTAELPEPEKAPRITKAGTVLALLQRDSGAALAELVAASGWLPHTTRAALTGLRKKGHAIVRFKRGEETCYRIVASAADAAMPA